MPHIAVLLAGLLLAGWSHAQETGQAPAGAALQGDPVAGKNKGFACIGCHGVNGIGNSPLWPNLAGQKEAYMVKQLRAFRDGTREDPLMTPPSQALSDQDIADLSAWYAGMPCPATAGE